MFTIEQLERRIAENEPIGARRSEAFMFRLRGDSGGNERRDEPPWTPCNPEAQHTVNADLDVTSTSEYMYFKPGRCGKICHVATHTHLPPGSSDVTSV